MSIAQRQYTAEQIRYREQYVIMQGLSWAQLMKNAGRNKRSPSNLAGSRSAASSVSFVARAIMVAMGCQIVAWYCKQAGWPVHVYGQPGTPLAQQMTGRLPVLLPLPAVDFTGAGLVVDALKGTGAKQRCKSHGAH
jgi:NAD(P)H-hydrate repair Nnr-like enzyme with NAD(P)H-hydrate epimerase domain